jgi:hypothetical protein
MINMLTSIVVPNLDTSGKVTEQKGISIVGSFGTGKSHLMSVISSVAEDDSLLQSVHNDKIKQEFAGFHSDEKYFGFIYTTIASGYFNQEKNRYATGATQVSLTNEGLRRISILVPSEDLIIKFSSIANHIIKKSELLKNQIQLLQQARDKLLPRLMSGEMEV